MQKSAKSLKIQENNCLTLLREQKTDNYVFNVSSMNYNSLKIW